MAGTQEQSMDKGELRPYQLYKFRFWIAFVTCFTMVTNAGIWATFMSISTTATTYFGTSAMGINILSLIFMALYIPVSPVSSWVLDTKGIKTSILWGSFFSTAGAFVRWLSVFVPDSSGSGSKYSVLIFGQVLGAIGQPFLLNAPTKVASVWFAVAERTFANACMSLGGPIGTALVVRYAPALVQGDPSRIPLLNLTVLVLSLASSLCAFSIRDKPKSPPSASASESNMPFFQGLLSILKNRNFIILLCVFGFYVGTFNVYITLISDYVVANGYTEDDAGNLGAVTICVGIAATLLVSSFMDRFPYHAAAWRASVFVATLGFLLFFLGTFPDRVALLYAGAAIIGLGGFQIEALSLEMGVESTWPVAEGTSAGLLWTSAQVFGIAFLFASDAFRHSYGDLQYALIFNIIVTGIAFLASLFYVNENRRRNVCIQTNVSH